ncbi:MAG: hypothetical protein JWQ05_1162, partial [Methylobacterium sp.]|nr:hypothetical protein [Methylobacterium sp.]
APGCGAGAGTVGPDGGGAAVATAGAGGAGAGGAGAAWAGAAWAGAACGCPAAGEPVVTSPVLATGSFPGVAGPSATAAAAHRVIVAVAIIRTVLNTRVPRELRFAGLTQ